MPTDPYEAPRSDLHNAHQQQPLEYAGFWIRVAASIVDSLLVIAITYPVLFWIYGIEYFDPDVTGILAGPADFLISWVFPAIAILLFWVYRSATPGKMVISAKILDADSGEKASTGQLIARYLGYFLSSIPLGLGFIWVAFDRRKQGWHDKLAGTIVARRR